MTVTLPNHTGMVTGRRIDADARRARRHLERRPRRAATVQAAAGHPVGSVFGVVHGAGRSTALFATKTKFSLFNRSWPAGDRPLPRRRATSTRWSRPPGATWPTSDRAFTFLHLSLPDRRRPRARLHVRRRTSTRCARTDRLLGRVLATIEQRPGARASHAGRR